MNVGDVVTELTFIDLTPVIKINCSVTFPVLGLDKYIVQLHTASKVLSVALSSVFFCED